MAASDRTPADASPSMRVLVTGATGFLGPLVVRRLLRDGDAVRVLVRPGHKVDLPGVEVVSGDLCCAPDVETAVRGADAVVHCGARVQTAGAWSGFLATNVEATARIIERAVQHGVRRVVHVS